MAYTGEIPALDDAPDWDYCNVSDAAVELREMMEMWSEIAAREEPDSDLYLRPDLIHASTSLLKAPTVKNAKELCALLPRFREICWYKTPRGEAYRQGALIAVTIAELSLQSLDVFYNNFGGSLKLRRDDLRVQELLILTYLTEMLIASDEPERKLSLSKGMIKQMSLCLSEDKILPGDKEFSSEVFYGLYGSFRGSLPVGNSGFSESILNSFVVQIAKEEEDARALYRTRFVELISLMKEASEAVLNLKTKSI